MVIPGDWALWETLSNRSSLATQARPEQLIAMTRKAFFLRPEQGPTRDVQQYVRQQALLTLVLRRVQRGLRWGDLRDRGWQG